MSVEYTWRILAIDRNRSQESQEEFRQMVSKLLNEGWKPLGGPSMGGWGDAENHGMMMVQAFTREKS